MALIDDGVHLKSFNKYIHASIQGINYGSRDGKAPEDWWESINGHGTTMANMITRINPFIALSVIKIDSVTYPNGHQAICPQGAADGLDAAVAHGADVISMSWTIEFPKVRSRQGMHTLEEVQTQRLSGAVRDALKDSRRILFCSATDEVHLVGNDTLPYSAGQSKIFCIGAATASAKRDEATGDGSYIHYFLPGKGVAEARAPYATHREVFHSGSSVSTALGAGLASLIIHCVEYADFCNRELASRGMWKVKDIQKYRRWALALRDFRWMRKAFENIRNAQVREDPKILPVWSVFGTWAERLECARSNEEKVIELNSLVEYLCCGFE